MKNEKWTIYRDSLVLALMKPTWHDLAESKSGARKAALSVLARFDAELAERVRAESAENPTRTTPQDEAWTVEPNADGCTLMVRRGPDARAVCNIWDDAQGRDDAALICAAPELLRALEQAEELLRNIGNEDEECDYNGYNAQFIPGVRNAIIEAISKAKGEQP